MSIEQKKYVEPGSAEQQAARTKDNAIGIDDIGLSEDIKPDGARKPEEIRPDSEKVRK